MADAIYFHGFGEREGESVGGGAGRRIRAGTVMTLLVSSYLVVLALPNPIAIRESLRRD